MHTWDSPTSKCKSRAESYEAKWVGSSPFASPRPCGSVLTALSPRTKSSTRWIARTRLFAHPCDGVGLVVIVAEIDCVWNDSTSLKINNSPFTCSSECSLASVPPVQVTIATVSLCRKKALAWVGSSESYEVKSSATALTTQICNFDGYTATGLLFSSCVTTTLLRCSDSTIAPNEKFDALGWAPDGTNWTSDDQCKVMYAADCTSSAGTVTGTLDVVNGSMAVIGSLPNGLAALGVMDGFPGGTGTGLFFWSLVMPIVQTSTRPWASYLPHCLGYPSFLPATLIRFILVAKTRLTRAVRSLTTAPERAWKAPL